MPTSDSLVSNPGARVRLTFLERGMSISLSTNFSGYQGGGISVFTKCVVVLGCDLHLLAANRRQLAGEMSSVRGCEGGAPPHTHHCFVKNPIPTPLTPAHTPTIRRGQLSDRVHRRGCGT